MTGAYASNTLTTCESNCSNIERELLGILFSILLFKHFTYRCKVHIITDHKPLVSLFRKSLTSASPRLSRMWFHILDYQLDVMYQPGTKMHLSDALSRLTSHNNNSKAEPIKGLDVTVHDIQIFMEISPLSLERINASLRMILISKPLDSTSKMGFQLTEVTVQNHSRHILALEKS